MSPLSTRRLSARIDAAALRAALEEAARHPTEFFLGVADDGTLEGVDDADGLRASIVRCCEEGGALKPCFELLDIHTHPILHVTFTSVDR